ncbi:MAG: response regulator [Deltaproteobacteria bacterium]|nr:response regulator [Deltaproteobacteria bacterium]
MRILLADDEPQVLELVTEILESAGHAVCTATDGNTALQALLTRGDVDALVTDYEMPHLTGGDLARVFRAQHPDAPICMISGDVALAPQLAPELDALGITFVSKPFSQVALLGALGARSARQ